MAATLEKFIDGLASRLYETSMQWREEAYGGEHLPRLSWYGLDEDLKQPYLDCARALLEAE